MSKKRNLTYLRPTIRMVLARNGDLMAGSGPGELKRYDGASLRDEQDVKYKVELNYGGEKSYDGDWEIDAKQNHYSVWDD